MEEDFTGTVTATDRHWLLHRLVERQCHDSRCSRELPRRAAASGTVIRSRGGTVVDVSETSGLRCAVLAMCSPIGRGW